MNNKPFKTYAGGKNGSGVYQAIINQIPPHEIFISAFAGNCGVLANKRLASQNKAMDVDRNVVDGWNLIKGIDASIVNAVWALEDAWIDYDKEDNVFIFLDPPYLMETRSSKRNYYKNEMSDPATHKKMLAAAINLKCNCAIIHYPCQLYNDMLKDWRFIDISGQTRQGRRIERLYMNYAEPTELHDYSFIGNNHRERQLLKKSKNNMVAKFKALPALERNFVINALYEEKIL